MTTQQGVLQGDVLGVTKEPQENHVSPSVSGHNVNVSLSKDVVSAEILENYGH